MSKYQNGKIYAIRSHKTDKIYIGSTYQKLANRMANHRDHYRRYVNKNIIDTTSYKILQYDDAYIELIENYPCNSKEELNKREGQHIRKNNCVNRIIPGRAIQEWRAENKQYLHNMNKKWKEDNKESHTKQRKEYYENNKEQILNKRKEKTECECGGVYTGSHRVRHEKSKRHQLYVFITC